MSKVKVISVRLKSLRSISPKAWLAEDYNGDKDVLPKRCVWPDLKAENAYWVAEWILEKKTLTFSRKHDGWLDTESLRVSPVVIVEHHIPVRIEPKQTDADSSLTR